MSDHLGKSGVFINSIVGDGTKFVGDLELNGLLRIDGDFIGNIRTEGKVLIGKNGRAECTILADTVVIGGVVKGDIISKGKVVILSTGMLIGNVSTPRLISEDGVILNGVCMIASVEEVPVPVNSKLASNLLEGEDLEKYNPAKISK
ncbi:MAG: polymer-forming cytoskeletal protein [Spirochaetales bacterium]|nr:polymer-forming cytoskeletal protein [Spirochaetales bacterium]